MFEWCQDDGPLTSPPHFVNSSLCMCVCASRVCVCFRTCVCVKDKLTEEERMYTSVGRGPVWLYLYRINKREECWGRGGSRGDTSKKRKEEREKRPLQESIQPDDPWPWLAVNLSPHSIGWLFFLFVVFLCEGGKNKLWWKVWVVPWATIPTRLILFSNSEEWRAQCNPSVDVQINVECVNHKTTPLM